jgi:hypothetical protein
MIFKHESDNIFFEQKGYIHKNFLSPEEVKALYQDYEQYMAMGGEVIPFAKDLGYYISVFDNNLERRAFINNRLISIFKDKVEYIMPEYKILYGNFMTKEPGGKEIEVHQDFSFVDEKKYTAFNFWIPLQDTDADNGGFHLIESSHKLFNSYRSATIPHNLTHYNEEFKKYMKSIPVKAGDGLIFDHRLFHYSSPNSTNKVRIAVQMVLIPKDVQPVMYCYRPEKDKNNLQIYKISQDYLLEENLWTAPEDRLTLIGTTPYEKIPDAKNILKKLHSPNNSLLDKLKKFFSHV